MNFNLIRKTYTPKKVMNKFKIETYLYDLCSVQKEDDDPANAILFKHPSDISIDKALSRVGNFVALYQSTTSLVGHSGLKMGKKCNKKCIHE